jgi:hypothetical protein
MPDKKEIEETLMLKKYRDEFMNDYKVLVNKNIDKYDSNFIIENINMIPSTENIFIKIKIGVTNRLTILFNIFKKDDYSMIKHMPDKKEIEETLRPTKYRNKFMDNFKYFVNKNIDKFGFRFSFKNINIISSIKEILEKLKFEFTKRVTILFNIFKKDDYSMIKHMPDKKEIEETLMLKKYKDEFMNNFKCLVNKQKDKYDSKSTIKNIKIIPGKIGENNKIKLDILSKTPIKDKFNKIMRNIYKK